MAELKAMTNDRDGFEKLYGAAVDDLQKVQEELIAVSRESSRLNDALQKAKTRIFSLNDSLRLEHQNAERAWTGLAQAHAEQVQIGDRLREALALVDHWRGEYTKLSMEVRRRGVVRAGLDATFRAFWGAVMAGDLNPRQFPGLAAEFGIELTSMDERKTP
jgi:chromosome segregation ATPase